MPCRRGEGTTTLALSIASPHLPQRTVNSGALLLPPGPAQPHHFRPCVSQHPLGKAQGGNVTGVDRGTHVGPAVPEPEGRERDQACGCSEPRGEVSGACSPNQRGTGMPEPTSARPLSSPGGCCFRTRTSCPLLIAPALPGCPPGKHGHALPASSSLPKGRTGKRQ